MSGSSFDPQSEVLRLYQRLGGWREVAAALDGSYSAGYWCAVGRGRWRASRAAENVLRRYLGLAPRGIKRLDDFDPAALAWYLNHRREVVTYG